MKKRLVSIILTVFLVLSMMPFAAFADNAIVCPACGGSVTKQERRLLTAHDDFYKCDKCGKWAWVNKLGSLSLFSVGDQQILDAADSSAIINFSFNNGHLIPAEKAPSGIGRKDLPGFEDEEGTAQVSKEGKLTYVAHPRLALNSNCVSVPYQDFFVEQEYHTDDCKRTGNHQSYCKHYQLSFNYNQYDYDYILVDALRHTRTYATFNVVYEVQNGVPGTYYVAKGQPLFRYRKSLGADEQIFYSPKQETMKLPTDSARYDDYGISRYQAYDYSYTVYSAAKGEAIKARVFRLVVTCDPDDNKITSDTNITITNNTWNGNIYVDSSTNLTYIYPQYTTVNEKNETVTNISNTPIIYNNETNKYYTYDSVTNNYYYINYEDTPTPTPSPSPSPTPSPSPSPSPDPTETPAPDVTPTPTDPPTPTTPPSPGGDNPGGSGSGSGSGDNSWNPFKWLADLLKDIVEKILKAIWKLITSIFSFLLWLLSLVGKLFPFIPTQAITAITAGAVIVTVIRIIKFITGR
ncbi:hypothetical protein NE586_06435 [Gemmiger formicilis]|uniref:hypothetical protein n=1 Tax=Gemmiger formicilis TaxID=745368 RepID=UPI0021092C03|nr:hypothetical protein [Gemmiger formicilis]MCQ5079541.1 hypothetical protein [Gemmiger formicilis]MCQ5115928.1 hypothetical protein [Gemmiger formicilis]